MVSFLTDISGASELGNPNVSISSDGYYGCYYNPILPQVVQNMMDKSYKVGCPIPIADLAYVQLTHYNMNGEICLGELVVHVKIAEMVIDIFKDIFDAQFPIESMRLIDEYGAIDSLSMGADNTSGFCYREIFNGTGEVSNHGLGVAIDINPLRNPYVKGDIVAPEEGRKYVNRSLNEAGMIHLDDAVVKAFKERGFTWGGDWESLKDYQHFEIDRTMLGIKV